MEPSGSTSKSQMIEKMDSGDSQRKRQFPDAEGFMHALKTTKVGKLQVWNPATLSNSYEILTGETLGTGTSEVVKLPPSKIRKMPPIVAKMKKIETSFVNSVKAQTNGQMTFEFRWISPRAY